MKSVFLPLIALLVVSINAGSAYGAESDLCEQATHENYSATAQETETIVTRQLLKDGMATPIDPQSLPLLKAGAVYDAIPRIAEFSKAVSKDTGVT